MQADSYGVGCLVVLFCFVLNHQQSPFTLTFLKAVKTLPSSPPHTDTHTPLPPPPTPARGGGGQGALQGRVQILPSQKTNINNTNWRGGRFPSLLQDAVPGPRGWAGRAGDARRYGTRSQASLVPGSTLKSQHLGCGSRRLPGGSLAGTGRDELPGHSKINK